MQIEAQLLYNNLLREIGALERNIDHLQKATPKKNEKIIQIFSKISDPSTIPSK